MLLKSIQYLIHVLCGVDGSKDKECRCEEDQGQEGQGSKRSKGANREYYDLIYFYVMVWV